MKINGYHSYSKSTGNTPLKKKLPKSTVHETLIFYLPIKPPK